jgi:hypothetical protein
MSEQDTQQGPPHTSSFIAFLRFVEKDEEADIATVHNKQN